MYTIPFTTIDWGAVEKTAHAGESGIALWQTLNLDELRVRIVEYAAGYLADHWCQKGHVLHVIEGDLITEMENGEKFSLTRGMSYVVSDGLSSHRSFSPNGTKLLIVDGDFLKPTT